MFLSKINSFFRDKILSDAVNILLLGLILRFIIAPFTLNWDLLTNTNISILHLKNNWAQTYDNPLSAYPPLTYMTLSAFIRLSAPFFPAGFFDWVSSGSLAAISFPPIFRSIFILKLPYIAFELTTAFIFSKMFEKERQNKVLFLWMINPVSLFVISAWTNVDVFPLLFLVISFYLANREKNMLASFSLGIATAYKLFPLLFFPFLLFSLKSWKEKIFAIALFTLPVVITHLPVLFLSQYYLRTITGGYGKQILFATLGIGKNRALLYYCFAYFLLFFHFLTVRKTKFVYLIFSFFTIIIMFTLSAFNLQWFIWLLPFLLFTPFQTEKLKPVMLLVYLGYFALVLLSQSSVNIGMLNPLEPTLWTFEWPLRQRFGADQVYMQMNIAHSLVAAGLVWIGINLHKKLIRLKE